MEDPSFSLFPVWDHEVRMHFSALTCAGCWFFIVTFIMQRTTQRWGNVILLHSKRSTQTSLYLLCELLFAPSMSWSSLLVFSSLQERIFETVSEGQWDCTVLSVLPLEIAASHCTSPTSLLSVKKKLLIFNYWGLPFFKFV